jgi:hypothetical protein
MNRMTRSGLCVAIVVGLIGFGRSAEAVPIVSMHMDFGYGDLIFDAAPGGIVSGETFFETDNDAHFDTVPDSFAILDSSTLFLSSGPFQSAQVTATNPSGDPETYTYSYAGNGTLTSDFVLELPGGTTHNGSFTAVIGPVVFTSNKSTFDGSGSIAVSSLMFDPATAALFGVSGPLEGQYSMYLDFNNDDFGETHRVGTSFGTIDLVPQAVPEPSLLALLPAGLGWALSRRRR